MPLRGRSTSSKWIDLGGATAVILAVIGVTADATSLWGNSAVQFFFASALPYSSIVISIALGLMAARENRKRLAAEAALTKTPHATIATWRRLVRVLAYGQTLSRLPNVDPLRLQPLLDELARMLPSKFGAHHKFSVTRPNADGSFTLLTTRGMDPASVAAIEAQASWRKGRSFYASIINDESKPEYRLFLVEDSAYIDTRKSGNSRSRPSSSGSHFLIALRDDDIYRSLPLNTLAIVSVGVPKEVLLTSAQQEDLYYRLLPAAKAIEALLLSSSTMEHKQSPTGPEKSDTTAKRRNLRSGNTHINDG